MSVRWILTDISFIDTMRSLLSGKSLAAGFFYVFLHENHIKVW